MSSNVHVEDWKPGFRRVWQETQQIQIISVLFIEMNAIKILCLMCVLFNQNDGIKPTDSRSDSKSCTTFILSPFLDNASRLKEITLIIFLYLHLKFMETNTLCHFKCKSKMQSFPQKI